MTDMSKPTSINKSWLKAIPNGKTATKRRLVACFTLNPDLTTLQINEEVAHGGLLAVNVQVVITRSGKLILFVPEGTPTVANAMFA
jgi:hypothetical protein